MRDETSDAVIMHSVNVRPEVIMHLLNVRSERDFPKIKFNMYKKRKIL